MDKVKDIVEWMAANPQAIVAKYPRYRELQRDLADAFLLEIIQQENAEVRRNIERGTSKRVKVFVDIAWDAEAYDNWKREEKVRSGIAQAMMQELIPPDFMAMSEEERQTHMDRNEEKIKRAFERIRSRTRYSGP